MLNTFHLLWYRKLVLIRGRAVKDSRDWTPKLGQGVLTALKHLAGTPHQEQGNDLKRVCQRHSLEAARPFWAAAPRSREF